MILDELVDFDVDVKEIEQIIERTSGEMEQKIDWTSAWGKKYPVLTTYQEKVKIDDYAVRQLSSPTGSLPPVRGGYSQRRKSLNPCGA